jgi:hypothetical protein
VFWDLTRTPRCLLFHVKGGRREAAVFQATAKLSDFYDPDEVVARYKQAGVTLDPGIFSAALEGLARAVVTQNLAPELTLPVTGLCLGYPIESTLELLKGQTAKK